MLALIRHYKTSRSLTFTSALIVALFLAAAASGALISQHPMPIELARAFSPPSGEYWLGLDAYGVSVSSKIVLGAWHSLQVGLLVTLITMSIGLLYGTLTTLATPLASALLTRVLDCFLAFPGFLLAVLLAAVMPSEKGTLIFALSATGWAAHARFSRALMDKTLSMPHVEAAIATGATWSQISRKHLWPFVFGQLAVQASLSIGSVILAEASLSFLGLGGGSDNPSWGQLIADGREYLVEAPHLSLFPGVALVLTVFSFNLFANSLSNALDPSAKRSL